jgi:hypothetical protein
VNEERTLLNVERLRMLAEVFSRTGTLHPRYHFTFPFESNPDVATYLLENGRYTEEELWQLSERREPMRSGNADEAQVGEDITHNVLYKNRALKKYLNESYSRRERHEPLSPAVA